MRLITATWLLFNCLLLAGCQGQSDGKLGLTGVIDLDGKPMESGEISFIPINGGPSCGATVSGGTFDIPASKGALPGGYKVKVSSWVPSGRVYIDPDTGEKKEDKKQIVADRYNQLTELVVNISSENASQLSFDVEAR